MAGAAFRDQDQRCQRHEKHEGLAQGQQSLRPPFCEPAGSGTMSLRRRMTRKMLSSGAATCPWEKTIGKRASSYNAGTVGPRI